MEEARYSGKESPEGKKKERKEEEEEEEEGR